MRAPAALAILFLAVACPGGAATLDVPATYPTVGSALAIAAAGDSVRLEAGRYPEYGLTVPGGVTLLGMPSSSEEVWFDGAYAGVAILTVPAGAAPVRIQDITFRYGRGPGLAAGSLAISAGTGRHVVADCRFERNTSRAVDAVSADILSCVFADNEAAASGGGMQGSDLLVHGCTFLRNVADDGGGLYIISGDVAECRFERNIASASGGGVYTRDALVHDCVFVANATTSSSSGRGGGMYSNRPQTFLRCEFVGNLAARDGGALWVSGPTTVEYCRMVGNSAKQGGGIYGAGFVLTVQNCSLVANLANEGGGIYAPIGSGRTLTLLRTLIQGSASGAAVMKASSAPVPVVQNCDVFANQGGDWTAALSGLGAISGNFSADALFCGDPAENAFVFTASPLLAANNPGGVDIGAETAGCVAGGMVILTRPPGIAVTLDGVVRDTPYDTGWVPGSVHTVEAPLSVEPFPGVVMGFVSWSDSGAIAHTVVAAPPPATLTATYRRSYQLTVDADSGGTAQPASGAYPESTLVTLRAIADSGFRATGWTGTGLGSYTGSAPEVTVRILAAITERARFQWVGYQPLTMIAGDGGTVAPGSGSYTTGSRVTIQAFPDPGWNFLHWLGTGSGSHSGSGDVAQVTMNEPITEQAVFVTTEPTVHIEFAQVGEGTVFPATGEYATSVPFSISAVPAPGFTFDRWLGVGSGSYTGPSRDAQITPLGPITQTAYFAPGGVYPLTMTATSGGVVSPTSGPRTAGENVQITATPATGHIFVEWQGSGLDSYSGPQAIATIGMHSPIEQHAVFALDGNAHGYEFSLSASATDPFRNQSDHTGAPREVHLWVTCAELGLTAFECGVQSTLPVLGFAPAPGVFNFGATEDLQLVISGCPAGGAVPYRLGAWGVFDLAGTVCLGPSPSGNPPAAVDCGSIPFTWTDPLVHGFSTDGSPPCITGVNGCGGPTAVAEGRATPGETRLAVPAPNPFRDATELRFALASPARTRLAVYDVAGRLIRVLRDESLPAGNHATWWDGRAESGPAAGGIYFVRLEAGGVRETKRVVYLGVER